MRTFAFTKRGGQWYIKLSQPSRSFNRSGFTIMEPPGGVLDEVADGQKNINLQLRTKRIKDAFTLELEPLNGAGGINTYYGLHNRKGKLLKAHLELSTLSLFIFGETPECIFLCKR